MAGFFSSILHWFTGFEFFQFTPNNIDIYPLQALLLKNCRDSRRRSPGEVLSVTTRLPILTSQYLQASGKTSFVNVITSGQVSSLTISGLSPFTQPICCVVERRCRTYGRFQFSEDKERECYPQDMGRCRYIHILVVRLLDNSDVTSGQPKFRSMWERYCNGVDAIV